MIWLGLNPFMARDLLKRVSSGPKILLKITLKLIHKIFEAELLPEFWSTFPLQMFSVKCSCNRDNTKLVRIFLGAT